MNVLSNLQSDNQVNYRGNLLLILLIISVAFFLKFGIPVAGSQIFFSFLIVSGVTAYGFLAGILKVHAGRLAAYAICMGVLSLTQLANLYSFSLLSLIMIWLIHFPYVFELNKGEAEPGIELKFLRKVVAILAVLGIAQYFLQFVIGAYWAFFVDHIVPSQFLMRSYYGLRSMHYGSPYYKPTAFFQLEPSNFSQLLALAIIIEMLFFKNLKLIVLYLVAIALTFSGTGLIPLLLIAPLVLIYQKKFAIFAVVILALLTAPLWSLFVGLDKTVSRTNEFFDKNSSGYARFISPYVTIQENQISEGFEKVFLGMGAGTLNDVDTSEYESATSTWGKLFYEYGTLGTIIYLLFFGYCIFSSRKDKFIIATLMIIFWILGEHLFPPIVHNLLFALLIWPTDKFEPEKAKL